MCTEVKRFQLEQAAAAKLALSLHVTAVLLVAFGHNVICRGMATLGMA